MFLLQFPTIVFTFVKCKHNYYISILAHHSTKTHRYDRVSIREIKRTNNLISHRI